MLAMHGRIYAGALRSERQNDDECPKRCVPVRVISMELGVLVQAGVTAYRMLNAASD
jgi:hypothetical protein